jgi:signal transduction histidine kinase
MQEPHIPKILTWLAAGVIFLVALAFPLGYFYVSYHHQVGSIESEVSLNGRVLSDTISRYPETWEFQQARFADYLSLRPSTEEPESRKIFNLRNDLVAESADVLEPPILSRSHELLESGVRVGTLTISRSLRPLILRSAAIGIVAFVLGIATFLVVRLFVLRNLYNAQRRAEIERLAGSVSIEMLGVPSSEIGRMIDVALSKVGGFMAADRTLLVLFGDGGTKLGKAYEWQRAEIAPSPPVDEEARSMAVLRQGEAVEVSRIDELEPGDRGFLTARGINALLYLPVVMGNDPVGLVGVESLQPRKWSTDDRRLLWLSGQVFASALRRKRTEEEISRYAAILEKRNRELQRFAQIASHDLQEPLRMISSYLQLIERRYRGRLDKEADEYIDYAVGGAKRLQALIMGISEYYQVMTRAKPFRETDCETVLQQALDSLWQAVHNSGATVTHDPLPKVAGDGEQLVRLLRNLLENAIVYGKAGEPPRIHVSAERQGDEWLFSVRDNGIGFEPQYRERIFGIFQRLHGVGEYSGTGIGLAMCKRIVEDHGGRIWAESELGEGATFYFTLPAS